MKAVRVHEFGGPEVLRYEDVPMPEPGPGQVRVKIAAAGLNFIDTYHRTGAYKVQLPITLGTEAAGVVDALGEGVTEVSLGDHVAYFDPQRGAYAEYAIADAQKLAPIPDAIDLNDAAAMMVQGLTAHYLTHSTFVLKSGQTALVHAAAGGLGQLLVQVAKRCGARMFGTVSTDEKARLAKAAGADEVILYTQVDFETEVKRLTDGKGVDVVYDSVGKTTFDKSLNCLHPRGCMVLCGQSSGAVPPLDPQVLNAKGSLFLTRPTLGHYIATREELLGRVKDLVAWISEGSLKMSIDKTFALAEAADAHRYLEARKTKGKVLLIP